MTTNASASQFPPTFLWGASTAAYQIEGAASEGGRGPCIWDEFCATPGKTVRGESGARACDHFHLFPKDIALMRELGLQAYRFSISWPRVMPMGRGPSNEAGWDFYARLLDALLEAGIEPMITLYHWDLPAALEHEVGGWADARLPAIFADYADEAFERFGDRVKRWLTINEPWCVVVKGYFDGSHAPGLTDRALGYRAGHHLLCAHALAVERFRNSRAKDGEISLALNANFAFPASASADDAAAAERAMLNFGAWFADPLYFGDYPAELRARLGALLPEFSDQYRKLLKNSADFLALNYYTSDVVRHAAGEGPMELSFVPQPERRHTEMGLAVVPEGLERLLIWLHERYAQPPMYITENGAAFVDEPDEHEFVQDDERIAYVRAHLRAARAAMNAGVDLRGYFVWSLLDNFEWADGYEKRFGIVRCDYATLKRTIKASGKWYADVIHTGVVADSSCNTEQAA